MPSQHLIGPFVRRFLLEDVTADRNLSPHTRKSYRDCLRLLFEYLATDRGTDPTQVTVEQVDATEVRAFLRHLEDRRGNSIATRNRRLASLRSLFRFIARLQPELVDHAAQVCAIPDRKAPIPVIPYLSRREVESLLAVPNRSTDQGRRDYCLLLLLYNTGARASEATGLTVGDLTLVGSPCARFLFQGRQAPSLPLVASYGGHPAPDHRNSSQRAPRAGVPKPAPPAADALRRVRTRQTRRPQGDPQHTLTREEAGQSSYLETQHRSPSAASRGRHQHDPGLARPRLSRDHESLRRSRPGDQGSRPADMRRRPVRTIRCERPELAPGFGSYGISCVFVGRKA